MGTLHHKGRKHSKKRNVGLVYDFLLREVIDCVLRDDDARTKVVVRLMKRHFRPGTELYREWRLFNAVVKARGADETTANAIIRETRNAVRRYDRVKLDREKSRLIHEVNHRLGDGVYGRGVPNYTLFATVQTLFNDWRDTGVPNIGRIADYERKLHRHLMSPPEPEQEVVVEASDPSSDALVVKLMAEKLNRRYSDRLSVEQRALLGMYALEGVSEKLVERFATVRHECLQALDAYGGELTAEDAYTRGKLAEVRAELVALEPTSAAEDDVSKYLKLCELKEELGA